MLALGHREVLAHHDHAVGLATGRRAVGELGHLFGAQPPVLELARHHDGFLDVVGPRPRLRLGRVVGQSRQRLPRRGRQIRGDGLEVRRGVVAEQELQAVGVPTVQVLALREVGIAAQQDLAEAALPADGHDPVHRRRRALVRGPVARAVLQPQHFARVGQRQHQGVITPGAVVGDVHALLALAGGGYQRAVHVDGGQGEEVIGLLPPDAPADVVEDVLQGVDVGRREAAAEVAGRGRVGDAPRAQCGGARCPANRCPHRRRCRRY